MKCLLQTPKLLGLCLCDPLYRDFGPFGHRFRYLFFCHNVGTLTPAPVLFFLQQMFQPFHFLFAIVGFLQI